ncbi:hypothetical protein HDU89_003330 [Geranomyces variabilis]|nr:hypothetical protein HDU89_003330 [Geranomyces variabilis]
MADDLHATDEEPSWLPLPKGIHGVVTSPWTPAQLSLRPSSSVSVPTSPTPTVTSSTASEPFPGASLVALELGDTVHLLEECDGWLRGYVFPTLPRASGPELGVFPASHIFSRALVAKRAAAADRKPSALEGVGPLPGPAVAPSSDDQFPNQTPLQRPGLFRGATAPAIPQSYSLPAVTSAESETSSETRSQRPLSYGPGFAAGSRKVIHPIPAPVRPSHETSAGLKESLIDEIAAVLRDWGALLRGYLDAQQYDLFNKIHGLFKSLSQGRRTLLSKTLKYEELVRLRKQLIGLIEEGNQIQNADLVIRHTEKGHILSERNTTIINLYRMHMAQAQRRANANARLRAPNASALTSAGSSYAASPNPPVDLEDFATRFTHMFLELKQCTGSFCLAGEYVELRFALYNHAENRMLTEDYVVHINGSGIPLSDGLKNGKARAIFADIPQRDLNDNVFLTCRLVRVGKMIVSEKESEKADRFGMGSMSSLGPLASLESSSSSLDLAGLAASSASGALTHFRRPLGWATIRVGEWLKAARGQMADQRDIAMRIYIPTAEMNFPTLYENIINKAGGYELATRAESLTITLNVIQGELAAFAETEPSLFSDTTLTPRNGFSDVLVPGDTRNALYLTLVSGDFNPGRKSNIRNVQITAQVRLSDGEIVDGCLSCGTGEGRSGFYDSLVYYHNASPRWNEVIRIDMPPEIFKRAHVFFTFRHCSSSDRGGEKDKQDRNFAYAFLPLIRGGQTVINDASHTLTLYKYDKKTAIPSVYLAYPAGASLFVPAQYSPTLSDSLAAAVDAMSKAPASKDTFVVRTQLCSTRLTQNVALHNLLHWRHTTSKGRISIESILTDFTMIGELEIIKFLPSILEALFAILDQKDSFDLSLSAAEINRLIFTALVFTLGIVMDKRFINHRSSIDRFINTRFKSTQAWKVLLDGFESLIRHPEDVSKARELRNAIKVWRYLLRFMVRSNGLSSASDGPGRDGRQDGRRGSDASRQRNMDRADSSELTEPRPTGPPTTAFIQSLTALFGVINETMKLTSPDFVIASQTLTLQYFATILPDLSQIFPSTYLVNVAATFVDSVRSNRAKLNGYKLMFVRELVRGFLFSDGQSRGVLVGCVSRWVCHWAKEWVTQQQGNADDGRPPLPPAKNGSAEGERENVKLCLDVVAEMVDKLQRVLEKREKGSRLGRGQPDNAEGAGLDSVPKEEHEATVMCVAELLPRLLEMYRTLTNEIDGTVGMDGRLRQRERAGSRPPFGGIQEKMLPRSPEIAQLGAILLAIAHLLKDEQIQAFLVKYYAEHGARDTVRLVSLLCEAFGDMISDEPFSPFWVGMNFITHRVALKMLRPVSELLRGEFLGTREEEEHIPSNRLSVVFSIAGSEVSTADQRSIARSFQTGATMYGTGVNAGGPSTLSEASGAQALIHRLWDRYFHVLLQLLNSRWLQIERFGPQRARVAHKLGADVRGEGGEMLRTMWEHLGSTSRGKALQAGFIPSLVGPFLQLTASPHPVLRSAAIELLFNTIEPEFEQVGHFGRVELECIERLHRLVTQDNLGDDAYRRFIVDALERRFVTRAMLCENDDDHGRELTAQGQAFLNCLDTFLELSLQIRDLPPGEQHDDQREEALVKMLRFLRTTGRRGVYVEYVYRLYEMQLGAHNPIEAALALKLHGVLFEWSTDSKTEPNSSSGYNSADRHTDFDRKEAIYIRCIELLESGQAWERAVELCRELGAEYEKQAYSYDKLADITRRQADLYANIATTSRSQPEYYRVGFYGSGCPAALRNTQQIYRGGDWEKLGTFCDRILQKYVGAKLAKSNAYPPPVEITEGEGLWLQVSAVKPVVDTRSWVVGPTSGALGAIKWEQCKLDGDQPSGSKYQQNGTGDHGPEDFADLLLIEPDLDVYRSSSEQRGGSGGSSTAASAALDRLPERVRSYYESNEVGMFSISRPVRKALPDDFDMLEKGDPAHEFLQLWTEKIVLVTQDRFPGLSRRSPVIRVEMFELSPVENAVIAVRGKTRQLAEMEKRFAPYAETADGIPVSGLDLGGKGVANGTSSTPFISSPNDNTYSAPSSPQQRRASAELPSVNPFTMALNGAVDAPVNGGIPMYRRAFLGPEYRARAERDGTEVLLGLLERAIEDQVEVIHRCLLIHDRIVPKPMRPLHEEIIGIFNRTFAEDCARLGLATLRPSLSVNVGRMSDGGGAAPQSAPLLGGVSNSSTTDFTALLRSATAAASSRSGNSGASTPAGTPPPPARSMTSTGVLMNTGMSTPPMARASPPAQTAGRRKSTIGLRHSGSTASSSRSNSKRDLTSTSMVDIVSLSASGESGPTASDASLPSTPTFSAATVPKRTTSQGAVDLPPYSEGAQQQTQPDAGDGSGKKDRFAALDFFKSRR